MSHLKEIIISKKYFIIEFVCLFIFSMVIHCAVNNTDSWYDDALYWNLGKACGWNVKNLPHAFRGWLLPYFFSVCYQFGGLFNREYFGYQIFASFMFSFTFTFSFVNVARMLKFAASDKRLAVSGSICGGLFFIFFRGIFIYTLSDFYAFSFSLLSVILAYYILECQQKIYIKLAEAFLLGLSLYAAYNIRTIYLFLVIACCTVLTVWQLFQKKWKQIIVTLPACFAGMLICSIPQFIVNHNLLGIWSWKVITSGLVQAENLMLYQLQCGITFERYATFVGEPSQYGSPGMIFVNRVGERILEQSQITEITSYAQLIKLFIGYPLDFIGIYVRHFLNILYPIYPNQYIYDISSDKSLLLITFYTILFIAVVHFITSFKLKSSRWVWFILILVPCVCILPGAVEIRFFIALYFLICMYAVLGLKDVVMKVKEQKVKYLLTYLIGFFLYVAYIGMLLGTTGHGITTIN